MYKKTEQAAAVPMVQKVRRYIQIFQMIEPGDRIIVGVSGGADSVCLFFILRELCRQMGFEMKVVHVEHGIRGEESRSDAAFVKELCERCQVEVSCVSIDVPALARKWKISLEEAGRKARYEAFEETKREWKGTKIAVGHNQNDQAETMLWNMARGSGHLGAAGIRPVRENVIRPLLGCSRREIEAFLTGQKIPWREDRTNAEMEYTRNVIRNRLLPEMERSLNAGTVEHMAELGSELWRTEEYLQKQTAEKAAGLARIQENFVRIEIPKFLEEDFLRERLIRYCLRGAGCTLKDLTRTHIEKICSLAEQQSGKRISLPGGWMAGREFEILYIRKEMPKEEAVSSVPLLIPGTTQTAFGVFTARIFENENQRIPQKKYTKWMNYDRIISIQENSGIEIRTRLPGDFLMINRDGGRKKIKTYFTEEKVPVSERERVPLAALGGEILWVVGYRISEAVKVTPDTKQILELEYKEEESWQKRSEF